MQYQSERLNVDDVSKSPGLKTKGAESGDCCILAVVYTDGSCLGNGAQSAEAGYGVFWEGDNHLWNGSFKIPVEEGPTNNKAELRAAIKAIQIGHENHIEKLEINSDSKNVILGVTQWSNQWLRNGWKSSSGEAVKIRKSGLNF